MTPRAQSLFPFGLALSLGLSLACGSSPPPPLPPPACTAANCIGCCGVDGRCNPGTAVTACGLGGATCRECTATSVCEQGACAGPLPPDGGSDGGSCPPPELVLEAGSASATGDTSLGNEERIGSCGGDDAPEQIFGFSIAVKSRVLIDVVPTSAALRPVIYLRTRCAELVKEVPQACIAATMAGAAATLLLDLNAGDYELVVDGTPLTSGAFSVSVRTDVDGDHCGSAIPLALGAGSANVATSLGMFSHDTSGSCGGEGLPDAVFSFTTTETLDLAATAATDSGSFDPALYLRGTCGGDQVGCSAAFLGSSTSMAAHALPPGTWYLWLDARRGVGGPIRLQVNLSPPKPGDHCSAPLLLAFSGGQEGGEANALVQLGSNQNHEQLACHPSNKRDGIYAFTIDRSLDLRVRASSPGFSSDHGLALRSGGCGGATLACAAPSSTTTESVLAVGAIPPGDYQLVVESHASTVELFALLSPPVQGDGCGDPAELSFSPSGAAQVASISGDTRPLFDHGQGSCGGSGVDAVYRVEVPVSATLEAVITPSAGFQPVLYLRASSCASGIEVGCAHASVAGVGATLGPLAVPAGTYFLWVDGIAGSSGEYTLDVTLE